MAYKNTYRKLKVICDADDVLMSCNEYALHLLSVATGTKYDLSEITDWGILEKKSIEGWIILTRISFTILSRL